MAKNMKQKSKELTKSKDIKMDKIGVFFKKSILKSILKILTMEHGGFRTFKSLKNINRLFTNIDMSKYKNNHELESYIWCITFVSKQWLNGIVSIDIIYEMAKRQPDYDNIKGDIITTSMNDPNIITAMEAKMLFDLIAEALQYGYVTAMREEYINLLDDITLDEPGAFRLLVDRLFLVSQSLLDIKHNTNMVANKVEFNTADLDSVKESISQTIGSLKTSNNIFKTGIRRLNTLLSPGYMNGKLYTYLGLPSSGKAQPDDTLIPTPSGMKRLDELMIGDKVFNMYGNPVDVTGIFPQGVQDTYEVTFSDGRKSKCNEDHLWYVYTTNHGKLKSKVLPLKEIMKDYKYITPGSPDRTHSRYMIPNNGVAQFNHQDIKLDPWVLGYIIGNGCCREDAFKLSCPDGWAPNKISKILKLNVEKEKGGNYSYYYRYNWNENSRVRTSDIIGNIPEVYKKYSHEKRIPKEYIFNSEYIRRELLRGLMDSDGSISVSKNDKYDVTYSTTSPGLVEDITLLLHSLGISCTIHTRVQDDKRDQYSIRLSVSNSEINRLFSYPKKYDRSMDINNKNNFKRFDTLRIVDIKKIEPTSQRCIMVDDQLHVYLTEQFIPTHNSILLLKSALDIRKFNPDYKPKTPGMKPCVLYITMENTFTETIERIWNMSFDDPIVNYSEEEALEKICHELGIDRVIKDDVTAYQHNEDGTKTKLDALLLDKNSGKTNIEIVMQYYPYRSINTDDLFTIIQDLRDENLEVCALVFDYIKRIEPAVPVPDNTKIELGRIVNELKALAVIQDIPVVTAHQMNRAAAATVDAAARQNKGDTNKLVGRENVGDSWDVIESSDFVAVLNSEYKPGTDDKYMTINVVKRRRIDMADAEFAKYTYLAHPFAKNNGLRLIDDINLDKVLSLQSLVSDIDIVSKEKANAVPRLKSVNQHDFMEYDDMI